MATDSCKYQNSIQNGQLPTIFSNLIADGLLSSSSLHDRCFVLPPYFVCIRCSSKHAGKERYITWRIGYHNIYIGIILVACETQGSFMIVPMKPKVLNVLTVVASFPSQVCLTMVNHVSPPYCVPPSLVGERHTGDCGGRLDKVGLLRQP